MGFFNSLSTRIPLALVGGVLYGLLTYYIILFLDLPSQLAVAGGILVFLFYFGSRFLILFSGINTLYYSKEERRNSKSLLENNSFYQTAQWVGKFYHYHDIILFVSLVLTSIAFLISLGMDWSGSKPFGETLQNLWNALTSLP